VEPDIAVYLNGKRLVTPETFREKRTPLPIPSYAVWLERIGKKDFQLRQWHSIPIPQGLLREGQVNQIDIVRESGKPPSHSRKDWVLFGDYPVLSSPSVFKGPLFQHFYAETSVYKFAEEGDFRLNGITRLYNGGVKSWFFDGRQWKAGDLSPKGGIQAGQYRMRIEMEDTAGKIWIY
jgi:hypothetical protein